jgi:hypothetical protein
LLISYKFKAVIFKKVIVSWNDISRLALDKITPVKPPIVNKAMNPIVNVNGVLNFKLPPYKVAIHENILIPVGTAMIIVLYFFILFYFILFYFILFYFILFYELDF